MRLEGVTQSELQSSLTNRVSWQQPRSRVRNARASGAEVRVVEDAERLVSKLKLLSLGHRARLLKAYVRCIDTWLTRSASGCSILAGGRLYVAGRIEEL